MIGKDAAKEKKSKTTNAALRQTRGFDQNPRVWRNVGFAPPPAGRRGFPGKPAGLVSRSFEIAFPERVLKKRMVWSYVGFC